MTIKTPILAHTPESIAQKLQESIAPGEDIIWRQAGFANSRPTTLQYFSFSIQMTALAMLAIAAIVSGIVKLAPEIAFIIAGGVIFLFIFRPLNISITRYYVLTNRRAITIESKGDIHGVLLEDISLLTKEVRKWFRQLIFLPKGAFRRG